MKNYLILKTFIKILKGIGIVLPLAFISLIFFKTHLFGRIEFILISLYGILSGFLLWISAEMMLVQIDIAENTAETNRILSGKNEEE